ncbi:glycoside hydrolase family 3 N-terminal domain-containing protein [Kibdelosporangium persicum]|uniref:Periplasmic beta-glucosidase n=1 Tax=Kibdelosporangium persicum TaxID=2698649 RepID=A0ABX2F0T5_9PSEU|nr:glycoside hydrolase family 3 N-terminal domain-containing protein [Kibdelosporangium persicum]NRN64500.1 Periplasmic beta-glucosidase [Kibdelosporangium persicum]
MEPWRDTALPVEARVADLISRMTLEEKIAQLAGVWVSAAASGDGVAPHQDELAEDTPPWPEVIKYGLGQLTRTFGTAPVTPEAGAKALEHTQREIMATNRFGIPAMAHEECLAGFTTWGATAYPVPLAWGATFDPALICEMGARIGHDMRAHGIHQGLAPVLDVTRDPRWGRTEETIGEDPYLVGMIGAQYVRGMEQAGIVATLKHFAGYSASRAGRNHAPVSMGPRELADVILPPFEMALREGARSVMQSYTEIDGVPTAADTRMLTGLLRDVLGFKGVVVSDYFGVSFLETTHGVAGDPGHAATQALTAGVDVELPTVRCYGAPLADAVRLGAIDESYVDRAVTRVLSQKCELGLLDPSYSPTASPVPLDSAANRAVARKLAEESVVLLENSSVLPLRPGRIAVVGSLADDPLVMLGCYSFPAHVGVSHPDAGMGIEIKTIVQALRERQPDLTFVPTEAGVQAAVDAAREADVCIAVVGDKAGLFGRGTSGEGCDAPDLRLPNGQTELLDALLATSTPTVVLVCSGRPYTTPPAAATVQTFFPGEEGADAIADVLMGQVNPSGRLPVSVPAHPGAQPSSYLSAPLGYRSEVSALDPTPRFSFGHGLSYTTFDYRDLRVSSPEIPVDGSVDITVTVTNTGSREGVEVVQLYLRDPVAQVTRPQRQLAGFVRVPLEPGRSADVTFTLHADVTSFTGRDGHRVVEPGLVELHVGRSSSDTPLTGSVTLTGAVRRVGPDRIMTTPAGYSAAEH